MKIEKECYLIGRKFNNLPQESTFTLFMQVSWLYLLHLLVNVRGDRRLGLGEGGERELAGAILPAIF